MTRMVALLVVMGIAGAHAAALTCELACATPVAASHHAAGCHAHAADAAELRVTTVPALCHHEAIEPGVSELAQQAPKAVVATVAYTVEAATSAPSSESARSPRWLLVESPPPLGWARPAILRI
jgi:hypothetical protein